MILHLFGPDSYRRNQKLRELLGAFQAKHEHADFISVDVRDGEDGWRMAMHFTAQPSMFTNTKLLVLYEPTAVKENEWVVFLKKQRETKHTFLLLSSESGTFTTQFSFLGEPPVKRQAFSELTGNTLELFVRREAERRSVRLSREAWELFLRVLRGETHVSWRAVKELEKLSCVRSQAPLTKEQIRAAIHAAPFGEVTPLVKMFAREASMWKRLALLEHALAVSGSGAHVFNSLVYQTQGQDTALLADSDVAVKSGSLEYDEALTAFSIRG